MSAFTTFLNLYKPGGGSTGLITPDEVVDIDRINANMDLIDAFAADIDTFRDAQVIRNQQYRGVAANIGSIVAPVPGDTYQETDGAKRLWQYIGSAWILYDRGLALVKLTAANVVATGGTATVDEDGSIIVTGCTDVSLRNVFNLAGFREFEISWEISRSTPGSITRARLSVGGTDNSASQYYYRRGGTSGAGWTEALNSAVDRFASFAISDLTIQKGAFRFSHANDAQNTIVEGHSADWTPGTGYAQMPSFVGEHRVASAFDGLTLNISAGTMTGRIRVLGYV